MKSPTPTVSTRKRMHSRSRRRAKNRCHPIKEGVLKKFKEKQGVDNKDSTSQFIQYADSIKGKDSETSMNGLSIVKDTSNYSATITILQHCRISHEVADRSKKICLPQKGVVAALLNQRNLSNWGIADKNKYKTIRIVDEHGHLCVLWYRNRLSFKESLVPLSYKRPHQIGKRWTRGCDAQPTISFNKICHQLQDRELNDSAGFKSTNVEEIVSIGPREKGRGPNEYGVTNSFEYRNKNGSTVDTQTFNVALNRVAHVKMNNIRKESPHTHPFEQRMHSTYQEGCKEFFTSNGCPDTFLDEASGSATAELTLSTNLFTAASSIGQHVDTPTPTPAMIVGPTNFQLDSNDTSWVRKHKGGNLYLADSMLLLDFEPQDIIFIDGNLLHGVTNIKGGGNSSDRFSLVYFSKYKRLDTVLLYGKYDPSFHKMRFSSRIRQA